jgi:hypothetical protein
MTRKGVFAAMAATAAQKRTDAEIGGTARKSDAGTTSGEARAPARPRLTLEFTPDAAERLREIKEELGAPSNADVIRKALLLFEWFLSLRREGSRVQIVEKSGNVTEMRFFL